jgi:hypothetical protein
MTYIHNFGRHPDSQRQALASLLFPILIGIIAFFVYIGPNALNPLEIQWLGKHDFLQSYFGWAFFRSTEWGNPIGINPRYGYDLASSIVYSDSIPLFAIPFKILTPLLPTPFQYFGIWLLCCYILQAVVGWNIAGLYTRSRLHQTCVALLLSGSPAILWRLDMTHIALAGHFVILYAIYLNLCDPRHKSTLWAIAVIAAALIHFYLFVIVFALWVANLFDRLLRDRSRWKGLLLEFISIIIALLFCAWQAGYFLVALDSVSDSSFGNYSMNLFSIFDSRGYSLFLKGISQQEYFDEGFNYLGGGGIFLLCASMPAIWMLRKNIWRQIHLRLFLCFCLLLLLLLSLTHQLHYGDKILHIPLPPSLISLLSIVRCSGRFFWPIYYLLFLVPAIVILKSYKKWVTLAIFILAVTLQFIDTSPLRVKVKDNLMHPPYEKIGSNLKSEFWDVAAKKYSILVARPVGPYHKSWASFGDYIDKKGMATNIVCLARVSTQSLEISQANFDKAIYEGATNQSILYLIEGAASWKFWHNSRQIKFNKNTDLLLYVDGYTLLAPGWKTCSACQLLDTTKLELNQTIPEIKYGQILVFDKTSKSNDLFLLDGWHHSEDWGIWANGNYSEAVFPIPENTPRAKYLTLEVKAFVSEKYPHQDIEIWSNNALLLKRQLSKTEGNIFDIPIPGDAYKKGYLNIVIKSLNPTQASKAIPGSSDPRELSIGLIRAYFH